MNVSDALSTKPDDKPTPPTRQAHHNGRNLLLLSATLALIIATMEVGGRIVTRQQEKALLVSPHLNWTNTHRYDPETMWAMKPDLRDLSCAYPFGGRVGMWKINTNNLGLRQPPLDAPKRRYRILAIGDSRTNGMGVNDDETWPAHLQGLLDQTAPGQYEVINAGVVGYTAYQGLRYLKSRGLALAPDLVIACFGYNEGAPIPPPGIGDCQWQNPEASCGVVSLLRKAARGAGLDQPPLLNNWTKRLSPGELMDCLVEIARVCRENGCGIAYLVAPSLPELAGIQFDRPHYAGLVRNAAAFAIAPVIDASSALRESRQEVYLDDIHLNSVGNRIVAEQIAHEIPALRARGKEPVEEEALSELARRDPTAAVQACLQLISLDPSFAPLFDRLDAVVSKTPESAEATWRDVVAKHPTSAQAHLRLGNVLDDQQKEQEALNEYHKAIELAPLDIHLQLALGKKLAPRGDIPGATAALAAAISFNPDSALWPDCIEIMKAAAAHGATWSDVEPKLRDVTLPQGLIDQLRRDYAGSK